MKKYFILLLLVACCCSDALRAEVTRRTVTAKIRWKGVPDSVFDDSHKAISPSQASCQFWDTDSKALFIRSSRENTRQLFKVSEPQGEWKQLTFSKESIRNVAVSHSRNVIAYSTSPDEGSKRAVYLSGIGDGDVVRMFPDSSRARGILFSPDGELLAAQITDSSTGASQIRVVGTRASGSGQVVMSVHDGTSLWPVAWDAEASLLLVTAYKSALDKKPFLVDVNTGHATALDVPYRGATRVSALFFGRTTHEIYLKLDGEDGITRLARFDRRTGEVQVITREISWPVELVQRSQDRKYAAFTVNHNGLSQLYYLDLDTLLYTRVPGVPEDVISSLDFSPNGQHLSFTMSGAFRPKGCFSIPFNPQQDSSSVTSLTHWTSDSLDGEDIADKSVRGTYYTSFDGLQIPVYQYLPDSDGPHPVLVWFHGGPEGQFRPSFRKTFQHWMSTLGVAIIAPNIRGSEGYGREFLALDNGLRREDALKDVESLLDWIAENPRLDQRAVAFAGTSYGGFVALAAASRLGSRVRAALSKVGMSHLGSFLERTSNYRRKLRRREYGDERSESVQDFFDQISPLSNIDSFESPVFIAQGEKDPRVPSCEADRMYDALTENGVPVWYMMALDEGHGFYKKPSRDGFLHASTAFFKTYLLDDRKKTGKDI